MDDEADAAVATPDGRIFEAGVSGRPLAAIGRALGAGGRAFGKLVMTVWRLAGALDAALWHGVKFGAASLFTVLLSSVRLLAAIAVDLVRWLPSRSGRAYCAASGVVLAVCSLWILDELRRASSLTPDGRPRIAAPPVDLEDPILAQIDGRYVHLSAVAAAARAGGDLAADERLTAKAAFERGFVDQYVDERLLSQAALEIGLGRDPDVARRLRAARERVLAAAYLDDQIAAATTKEAIASLVESQSDIVSLGEEVRARHILVRTEDEAREILTALEEGGDFSRLARERSIDRATAPLGGEIGYFTRDIMEPRLARAAFSTRNGRYAPIFFTEHGWHVLQVLDRRAAKTVDMARVDAQIRRFLALEAVEKTVSALRSENEVYYFEPTDSDVAADAGFSLLSNIVARDESDDEDVGAAEEEGGAPRTARGAEPARFKQ